MIDDTLALKLAKEAFSGSTTYFDANIRPMIERDIRQFQSRHAADSKYLSDAYRSRSRLFRPKTRSTVRKHEAVAAEAFFSTLDAVAITAGDEQNPNELASADVMKALMEHRLQKTIPWFMLAMAAYQESMVAGVTIGYIEWQFNPERKIDKPAIELVPVENLRIDPGASWLDPIGTSPYLIQLVPMYVKDIKARIAAKKWRPVSDEQLKTSTKSFDTTRLVRDENRTDARDAQTAITDFTMVWVHRNVVEIDGIDYLYYTVGTDILLSTPEPLKVQHAHGRRPYVLGISVIEAHKNYPGGSVRLTKDVQAEINEIANQRIDNVKLVLNKRYFVKRNKQVDIRSLTRNVPGGVSLMNDPDTDVKVVDTPDVTSSSYEEQDRLNLDFDESAGSFSNSSVSSNRRLNETVGGMDLLTNDANQLGRYQLKTFVETWVEPMLRLLMLCEQHYETDEMILALAAKKAQLFQKFGIDAVTDELLDQEVTLTVNVGMGATNPREKINSLLLGINGIRTALQDGILVQHGVDATAIIKEIFGALGHKDGGKFLIQTDDPRIASLTKQVEELQAAIDAKHPPELLAAMVKKLEAETRNVEADKVKKGVEAAFGALQTAEVIAAVPGAAPVGDKVMEVAGYVPPTPPGVDPNFPNGVAPLSDPALTAVQSGATEQVADASSMVEPNTSPMQPAIPQSPVAGVGHGIETNRSDSVGV